MKAKPLPSLKKLNELFSYNEETGELIRKIECGGQIKGTVAGGINKSTGYIVIKVDRQSYSAHRIAWKMYYGEDPMIIDHINQIKTNNKISNLRNGTKAENSRNQKLRKTNKSGKMGVFYCKVRNKFKAHIRVNYKLIYLGAFVDKKDAIEAREKAEKKYGFFSRHGLKKEVLA